MYEKALCVELAERGLSRAFFAFFGSFAFICGKKENIEYAQWWIQLILWSTEPLFSGFSASFQKSRTRSLFLMVC